MNILKKNLVWAFSFMISSIALAIGADKSVNYGEMRAVVEQHRPVYAAGYAKNIKGKNYGIQLLNGFLATSANNLGSTSRKSFDGNKFMGYFQKGAGIGVYIDGNLQGEYPLMDKFEHTIDVGNAQIVLSFELKDLPVVPAKGMVKDVAGSYETGKVYYITMDVIPISWKKSDAKDESSSSEWFDPTLRYNYETQVRCLKNKYLTGVNLDKMSEKDLEYLARMMSAERRELGRKYKAATPEFMRKNIYQRNMERYGDQDGPTIAYMRNVEGKTWRQIIDKSSEPAGVDVPGTWTSYKLGQLKNWWYGGGQACPGTQSAGKADL